ncbi:MFS general substrate transporter, partial [Athelia psychrophila]
EIPFVFLLCMAQGATQWGLAMSIAPLHIVGAHFGIDGDAAQESWSAAAYSLTVGTFILVAGRLGDLYGHKRLFIIGWLWYALWSVIGGVSYWGPNVILFDFCRGMQGIGPALLFPNALAILGRTYPPGRRKEMVFSFFGLAAPSGFLIGSVFAGLISQLSFWPWLYWINAIACVIFALLSIPLVPSVHEYNPIRNEPGHLDIPGCITGVIGLVLINFSWNQGPGVGWSTVYVYVLLIVGFCFMGLFFWIELHARHPLIPIKSLSTEIVLVLGAVAAGWASFGIWLFYLYQMWEVLRGQTPLASAAQISPVALAGGCAAITTGLVISKIHPGWLMLISMTAFTVGNVLLATMPIEQTYWTQSFIASIVTPWGMDMSFPASNIMVSNFMPRNQQGLSASLVNTVINYSISIGLGVAGTVESRILANGGSTLEGYRSAWYVGIGLGVLGMAISVCLLLLTGKK